MTALAIVVGFAFWAMGVAAIAWALGANRNGDHQAALEEDPPRYHHGPPIRPGDNVIGSKPGNRAHVGYVQHRELTPQDTWRIHVVAVDDEFTAFTDHFAPAELVLLGVEVTT